VAVIEAVAGRSWKVVELFGASRLRVSHFYLRFPEQTTVKKSIFSDMLHESSKEAEIGRASLFYFGLG